MNDLISNKCEACNESTPKLSNEEIVDFSKQIKDWKIVDNHHLIKKWSFKNFLASVRFINKVALIAESEGHHPNISFGWGFAEITIWTHAINGLSKNDFILAAKIDAIKL